MPSQAFKHGGPIATVKLKPKSPGQNELNRGFLWWPLLNRKNHIMTNSVH